MIKQKIFFVLKTKKQYFFLKISQNKSSNPEMIRATQLSAMDGPVGDMNLGLSTALLQIMAQLR